MTPTEALARQKERDELLALIAAVSQRDHPPRTEWQSGYSVAMAEFRAILSRPIEQAAEAADREAAGGATSLTLDSAAADSSVAPDWMRERWRKQDSSAAAAPDKVPTGPFYRTAAEIEQAAEATDREREAVGQPGARPGEGTSAAVAPLDVKVLAALGELLMALNPLHTTSDPDSMATYYAAYDRAAAAYADAIRKRDPSAPADPTGGGA